MINTGRAATSLIGAPVRRREDPALVTGQGKYVTDICPGDMLHVAVLCSPCAHAEIHTVDTKSAAGVVAVLTGAEVKALLAEPLPMLSPAGPPVFQRGDPLGMGRRSGQEADAVLGHGILVGGLVA